jgi:hypothetical protein
VILVLNHTLILHILSLVFILLLLFFILFALFFLSYFILDAGLFNEFYKFFSVHFLEGLAFVVEFISIRVLLSFGFVLALCGLFGFILATFIVACAFLSGSTDSWDGGRFFVHLFELLFLEGFDLFVEVKSAHVPLLEIEVSLLQVSLVLDIANLL